MSDRFREVALDAALRAGAFLRSRFGSRPPVSYKGSSTNLVTEMDRGAEAIILEAIRSSFPDHRILAEESGALPGAGHGAGPYRWIVDPLDGTTNYAHGYPCFCSSVALAVDGAVVAGAVYEPLRDELYTAERGAGAHLNGRRLRVSETSELVNALLITGFPYDLHQNVAHRLRLFNRLIPHARAIRRDGAAALDLSLVAAGRLDAFFEERLQPWDIAAGGLLVEEAGGRVSRFDGGPAGLRGEEYLASNGRLHEALVAALREETPLPPPPAVV
jgi:myo-inositol-1(or 4)-monophosphatase